MVCGESQWERDEGREGIRRTVSVTTMVLMAETEEARKAAATKNFILAAGLKVGLCL